MYYVAALELGKDGKYDVTFPALPGCVSQGDSMEDALRMAGEALSAHLALMVKSGEKLPMEMSVNDTKALDMALAKEGRYQYNSDTIYQVVVVNIDSREEKAKRYTYSLKPSTKLQIAEAAKDMGISESALITIATRDYIKRME